MSPLETQIMQLSMAKRHPEAIALARGQLQRNPNDARSHFILAQTLTRADEKDQGLFHADRAVNLQPFNAIYSHYAGSLYNGFLLYEFALPLLQRAVATEPGNPHMRCALALCYEGMGQSDKAASHFEATLKLETDTAIMDNVRLNLARSYSNRNQLDNARAILEPIANKKSPLSILATFEMSMVSKEGPDSKLGKQLSKMVSSAAPNTRAKENALLGLGRMYNNVKDYDRAFGCWKSSRQIALASDIQPRQHKQMYQSAKSHYTPDLFKSTEDAANQTSAITVVCGMPRSGTTLTEQILSAHSQIAAAGELSRWSQLDTEFIRRHSAGDFFKNVAEAAKKGELRDRGDELLRILRLVSESDAARIVEKTPHSFISLGYIRLCCPQARFIHLRRNPLDSFISTYQNPFMHTHGYAFDQVEYAKEFLWKEQMMALWTELFPQNILTINYEDLARDPETVAPRMIKFLGLEWEDACLEFYRSNKAVRTFSMTQVRSPVHDSSVGRWKNYRKHLGPIMDYLDKAGFAYDAD